MPRKYHHAAFVYCRKALKDLFVSRTRRQASCLQKLQSKSLSTGYYTTAHPCCSTTAHPCCYTTAHPCIVWWKQNSSKDLLLWLLLSFFVDLHWSLTNSPIKYYASLLEYYASILEFPQPQRPQFVLSQQHATTQKFTFLLSSQKAYSMFYEHTHLSVDGMCACLKCTLCRWHDAPQENNDLLQALLSNIQMFAIVAFVYVLYIRCLSRVGTR